MHSVPTSFSALTLPRTGQTGGKKRKTFRELSGPKIIYPFPLVLNLFSPERFSDTSSRPLISSFLGIRSLDFVKVSKTRTLLPQPEWIHEERREDETEGKKSIFK